MPWRSEESEAKATYRPSGVMSGLMPDPFGTCSSSVRLQPPRFTVVAPVL